MTAIAVIIVFGLLIFIHELGHFLAAKRMGIGVEIFSLGFGPKLVGMRLGETEYRLSALPLGGYVKLVGDDPREVDSRQENAFLNQPVRSKLAVVIAGPLFNLLLAILIFAVIFTLGVPSLTTVIGEILPDSPALKAGLQVGDRIVAIDQKPINEWTDLVEIIQASANKKLAVQVERNGELITIPVVPQQKQVKNIFGEDLEIGQIGIAPQETMVSYNPLTALGKGVERTGQIIQLTLVSIIKLIQGKISASTIAGPVGIAGMIGSQAKEGFLPLANLTALLSISLGILNLFPIPILDGGHILFFCIEGIRGRPLNVRTLEKVQQIGLVLLISLMLLALYNDIMRIFIR